MRLEIVCMLSLQDLEKIKDSALFGIRKGQEGIFYPPIDIKYVYELFIS